MFECSTGDITAYPQTRFFQEAMRVLNESEAERNFFVVLDEAYKAIKDGKHITPFPGADIAAAVRDGDLEAARVMRSFNKLLCSDRIAIERCFGQMVRNWGILWGALPFGSMEDMFLRVCVKLHNLSVDDWLCNKFSYATAGGAAGTAYALPRLPTTVYQVVNSGPEQPEMPPPEDGVLGLTEDDLLGGPIDTDDANVNTDRIPLSSPAPDVASPSTHSPQRSRTLRSWR
jgi:hypothetical protein